MRSYSKAVHLINEKSLESFRKRDCIECYNSTGLEALLLRAILTDYPKRLTRIQEVALEIGFLKQF